MPSPTIQVQDLRKVFSRDAVAVDGISFAIAPGEIVSLLGPSGCGKTTTLRCIAGLEVPDEGRIRVADRVVSAPDVFCPPEERGLSMVFQQYALWPHMTVEENVRFGLRVRKTAAARSKELVEKALRTVQLWEQRGRRISQLSGGQQQRVALARAIAFEPAVILFDEPLSNLDAKLRETMRIELVELHREFGFAGLYVTHDQMEAISVSDRVIIMNQGHIEQIGTPYEIWAKPSTRFVANFIGETNEFTHGVFAERGIVDIGGGIRLRTDAGARSAGTATDVFIPYEAIEIVASEQREGDNTISGRISLVNFQGFSTLVKVSSAAGEVVVRTSSPKGLREGDSVTLRVSPDSVRCFAHSEQGRAASGGRRSANDA